MQKNYHKIYNYIILFYDHCILNIHSSKKTLLKYEKRNKIMGFISVAYAYIWPQNGFCFSKNNIDTNWAAAV